jgi:hypothetical protein
MGLKWERVKGVVRGGVVGAEDTVSVSCGGSGVLFDFTIALCASMPSSSSALEISTGKSGIDSSEPSLKISGYICSSNCASIFALGDQSKTIGISSS